MRSGDQRWRFLIALGCLVVCAGVSHAAASAAGRDAGKNFPAAQVATTPVAADISVSQFRSLLPVYRFWSPVSGKHFYTIEEGEREYLIQQASDFWTFETIAYYAYARDTEPNLAAVYRFWSDRLIAHFYTVSEEERDLLIQQYPDVWAFEGPVFYAYPDGNQPAQASAVYRFWSETNAGHFYTIQEAERDFLLTEYPGIWALEGVAWYAYKDPNVIGPAPSEPGVFEFSGGPAEASCTFTLKAYVDGVEAAIDDPRLTFVPQAAYLRMAVDFQDMTTTFEELLIESQIAAHTTTIRAGEEGSIVIPLTLSNTVIFWATTPRGPYPVNPRSLAFPTSKNVLAGDSEMFTLSGSATVDERKINVGVALRATRFAEGQGQFEDSALPESLDVRMVEPFEWIRSQREDRLLETTVNGREVQLYVTSAQFRTTGLWQGRPAAPGAERRVE